MAASVSRAKTEVKILNEQVKRGRETGVLHFFLCQGGQGSCQAGSQEGEEDDKEERVGRTLLQVTNRNQQFMFYKGKNTTTSY